MKTKQITDGSMLLAITAALILMDRIFAFFFEDIILLLVPVSLLIYTRKYDYKSTVYLSIAFLFLVFIGNITTILYIPVGVVVGLVASKKINSAGEKIFISMITAYSVCEVLITLFIQPALGLSIEEQMGNKTGKYALSCFIFMIQVVAYLETSLTLAMTRKLLKVFSLRPIKKIDIINFKLSKTNIVSLIILTISLPLFVCLPVNNTYLITFSFWSFAFISFLCYTFIKVFQGMIKKEAKKQELLKKSTKESNIN